jgi:hypothetical protein
MRNLKQFADMTDAEMSSHLRQEILKVRDGGIRQAKDAAEDFSLRGLVAGVHVGKNDMTPREVMEWYGGQLIDIVDNNFWFAMNSFVNCVDKFCPEV